MGGNARIQVYATSELQAENAVRAAFQRIADIEQVTSDYRPTSEIRVAQLAAVQKPVALSTDLRTVLLQAQKVSKTTDGAFDITVGPLVALWREARKTGRLPDASAIAIAKAKVGYKRVDLLSGGRSLRISQPGTAIDLGGIAKGYACSQAIRALSKLGILSALVEMGGDMAASAPPPEAIGWRVQIEGTETILYLKNEALSTSGSTEQFVEIDGKRYSHIVDPKTGYGLGHLSQVSVRYPDGSITDPVATALCIDESLDRNVRRQFPGIQIIRVRR
jgi:thiamine biosynthesis lipoprotein